MLPPAFRRCFVGCRLQTSRCSGLVQREAPNASMRACMTRSLKVLAFQKPCGFAETTTVFQSTQVVYVSIILVTGLAISRSFTDFRNREWLKNNLRGITLEITPTWWRLFKSFLLIIPWRAVVARIETLTTAIFNMPAMQKCCATSRNYSA